MTSVDYPAGFQPHGGQGVPGTFTFSANGSTDVVAYTWGQFSPFMEVPAPQPGADATITYTPSSTFEQIAVYSMDSAHNRSPVTTYRFRVNSTAPLVEVTVGGFGLPSRLQISTDVAGVTEFGYRIGGAAEARVAASDDGTADVSFVFETVGTVEVEVRSYAGTRLVGADTQEVFVADVPFIESTDFAFPEHDGVVDRPGTFTLRPGRPGVVAYEYAVNSGAPARVDASADGTAVLTWTPVEPGWTTLYVRSVQADGAMSGTAVYEFNVVDIKPIVYSDRYLDFGAHGGVGIPGEFTFDTFMPDVDLYVYQFDDGPEQTVDPEFSYATVTLTPQRSGPRTLSVRTRFLDGSFSPARVYASRSVTLPSPSRPTTRRTRRPVNPASPVCSPSTRAGPAWSSTATASPRARSRSSPRERTAGRRSRSRRCTRAGPSST